MAYTLQIRPTHIISKELGIWIIKLCWNRHLGIHYEPVLRRSWWATIVFIAALLRSYNCLISKHDSQSKCFRIGMGLVPLKPDVYRMWALKEGHRPTLDEGHHFERRVFYGRRSYHINIGLCIQISCKTNLYTVKDIYIAKDCYCFSQSFIAESYPCVNPLSDSISGFCSTSVRLMSFLFSVSYRTGLPRISIYSELLPWLPWWRAI